MYDANETVERTVLGAAFESPLIWLEHAGRIHSGLFFHHRVLASELFAMTAEGKATDVQSVYAWLVERKITTYKLSELIAIGELAPVTRETMAAAISALRENAKLNAIRALGNRLIKLTREKGVSADEILTDGANTVHDIATQSATSLLNLESIGSVAKRVVQSLNHPRQPYVKAGFQKLDEITGGFKPGQLIVLGARPSMGKTALALNFAQNATLAGKTVIVFSLEMTREEVCQRVLSNVSNVNLSNIATRNLRRTDMDEIIIATDKVHKARILIGESTHQMEAVCRRVKHQSGLDLVIVDYLQLIPTKAESREQAIAALSRRLKLMAKQLGVAVIVLSQLNRQVEQRTDKTPQLSDLRESGAIEQDADLCLLLWRPGYYDHTADQKIAELEIAKNRNGPTGVIAINWIKECAKFEGQESAYGPFSANL